MKKILTLLICVGAATLASAQDTREMEDVRDIIFGERKDGTKRNDDRDRDRDVVLGRDDRRYDERNRYPSNTSRSSESTRIRREYDAKINSIRNNRHLSRSEKERAIRQLEADRDRKLRQLNERYSNDRRYNDRDYDDRRYSNNKHNKNKKGKGNNGNHYGWQKGKGNPHRDRD